MIQEVRFSHSGHSTPQIPDLVVYHLPCPEWTHWSRYGQRETRVGDPGNDTRIASQFSAIRYELPGKGVRDEEAEGNRAPIVDS